MPAYGGLLKVHVFVRLHLEKGLNALIRTEIQNSIVEIPEPY